MGAGYGLQRRGSGFFEAVADAAFAQVQFGLGEVFAQVAEDVHRDPAGFALEVSPVDRKLVATLATTAFTDDAHNAVFVGGPGTGKAHLATAVGVSGITKHDRVRHI